MSHVVILDLEIRNLHAVKRLCENLGWVFQENQKTYAWFGRWVGDYNAQDAAINHNIKIEDLGKCHHAISIPNTKYELGIIQVDDHYQLVWDFYDKKLCELMGGQNGNKFLQEYGLATITLEAEQQGHFWESKKLDNGTYEVEVQKF